MAGRKHGSQMIEEIVAFELACADAARYFIDSVDTDDHRLSSKIENQLPKGTFFALAPKSTSDTRLKKLAAGGILPSLDMHAKSGDYILVPVSRLTSAFAKVVSSIADASSTSTAFIREPYLDLSAKSDLVAGLVAIDKSLYKVVDVKSGTQASLQHCIDRYNVSRSFFMLLSNVNVEEKDMNAILSKATCIAVNAYDGQSYLYWLP